MLPTSSLHPPHTTAGRTCLPQESYPSDLTEAKRYVMYAIPVIECEADSSRNLKFNVCLSDETTRGSPGENTSGRGPRVYKIKLTKVATINPE
ncbi:hypothetical protein JVT61DRAFT_12933 [Boletus reticuloceps]|uniref:Uncharacterized protein n=1 Tax=Boletus reticuloceps TaxID=495285 RepID=A0A8I3ACR2_9AGAM|nr:hypothetical protein JVT61DRAFT_12933 [Boletus reticuloceps]